jgi:Rhodopirellula transposase DDE domain
MAGMAGAAETVASTYRALIAHLDERQRRLLLGVEARRLGRGGIKALAEAAGVHPDTIARGVRESEGVAEPARRVRAPGGGRKKLSDIDPELMAALKALVDPDTRGDPMSPLVWTTKSTRNLAAALCIPYCCGPAPICGN